MFWEGVVAYGPKLLPLEEEVTEPEICRRQMFKVFYSIDKNILLGRTVVTVWVNQEFHY